MFGTHADPTTVWRERAASIRQQRMRSESDGHLAARRVSRASRRARERSPRSRRSLTNRYHPTVQLFLEHAEQVRERSGWETSFAERRVAHVRAVEGGFSVDGEGRSRTCWSRRAIRGSSASRARCTPTSRTSTRRRSRSSAPAWPRRPSGETRSPPARRSSRSGGASRCAARSTCRARTSRSAASPGFHRLAPAASASALLQDLGQPSYPPGREWDVDVPVADRAAARLPGDRGDRLPQGLARGRAPRRSGRGARARDARPLPRARARLDRSRP